MTRPLAIAALATTISLIAIDAHAWTRKGAVFGPRGISTVHAHGSCANGSCNRSITRTGPYGGTMSRTGSASCSGGVCNGSRTTTGPRGNTVTRQGTITR
jgi:hypothetical protein